MCGRGLDSEWFRATRCGMKMTLIKLKKKRLATVAMQVARKTRTQKNRNWHDKNIREGGRARGRDEGGLVGWK